MNDTLNYFRTEPSRRPDHSGLLTFSMAYFYNERYLLPFSHDESVHGKATILQKMWGDYEGKFPQARALYLYMAAHPGKKLNFMGNEFGQLREWDETREQDWNLLSYPKHSSFLLFMRELNKLYLCQPAFYEEDYGDGGFLWVRPSGGPECVFAFERRSQKQRLLFCFCFGDKAPEPVSLNLEAEENSRLALLLDTEWQRFGGSHPETRLEIPMKKGRVLLSPAPFSGQCYLIC